MRKPTYKITKKFVAMLVVLALALTLAPMAALAEETPTQEEPVCVCETLCEDGIANADCAICDADIAACNGKAEAGQPTPPIQEPKAVPAVTGEIIETGNAPKTPPTIPPSEKIQTEQETPTDAPKDNDADAPIVITAFAPLPEETAAQSYGVGAVSSEEELQLPAALSATKEDGETTEIPVGWACTGRTDDPSAIFDPSAEGSYAFAPSLPAGYTLGQGLSMPSILVTIGPAGGFAPMVITDVHTVDGFKYKETGYRQVMLLGFEDPSDPRTELIIPQSISDGGIDYSVTGIGARAFYSCTGLTGALIIPEGVTHIGAEAFEACSGFDGALSIPEGVTSIGDSAFRDCTRLTGRLIIPKGVTHIGNLAFDGCGGFTGELNIPEGVTSLSSFAFSGCSNLTSVRIPDSVKSISDNVFEGCAGLTSVHIPDGVKSIDNSAFEGCRSLTSVHIPDSVTSLGSSVFSGCISLTSVRLSGSMTRIENSAFHGSGLTSVHIPESVTSIGEFAFMNCGSLTSVRIPGRVQDIGESAFSGCHNDLKITAASPAVAALVKASGFPYAGTNQVLLPNITEHTEPGGLAYYLYEESGVKKAVVARNAAAMGNITIPEKVNTDYIVVGIGMEAFYGCSNITGVTILAGGVTSIGSSAFKGCTGLTGEFIIPPGVISIGTAAFDGCGLTSVNIPDSVTSIGPFAFYGCGLTSVNIPNGVTSISNSTFKNCRSLASAHIPDSVTSIGDIAFEECRSLIGVNIPGSVTSIGRGAFRNCKGLTSLNIPGSVTSIGPTAFSGCTGLTSVNISDGVISIGNSAFLACEGLTGVRIPDSVTSIDYSAFRGCIGLTEVFIGSGLISINLSAFDDIGGNFMSGIKFSTNSPRVQLLLVRSLPLDVPPYCEWDGSEDVPGGAIVSLTKDVTRENVMIGEGAEIDLQGHSLQINSEVSANNFAGTGTLVMGPNGSVTGTLPKDIIISYYVKSGFGHFAKNGGDVSATINADFSKSTDVSLGGETLTEGEHYTKAGGSTVITLMASYLKTLPDGSYTVQAGFTDGYASIPLSVGSVAPTVGDVTAPAAVNEGQTLSLAAPAVTENGAAITVQGWQISADGSTGWQDFDPATIMTAAHNGQHLRYYATNSAGTGVSANTVQVTVNANKPVDPPKPNNPESPAPTSGSTSPKTGDESNLSLYIVLLIIAGAGIAGVMAYRRRRRRA